MSDIFELAKKFQCHSHGYMCSDCPQPDSESEAVDLISESNQQYAIQILEGLLASGMKVTTNRGGEILVPVSVIQAEIKRLQS